MFNKSKNDDLTYGIVGLGRFGYALAMEHGIILEKLGAEVVYHERDMAIAFRKNDILYLVGSKDGLFTFGEWIEK